MKAKDLAKTALTPELTSARAASSRELPQPKAASATTMLAPCATLDENSGRT
jgi:hypothetical protein